MTQKYKKLIKQVEKWENNNNHNSSYELFSSYTYFVNLLKDAENDNNVKKWVKEEAYNNLKKKFKKEKQKEKKHFLKDYKKLF